APEGRARPRDRGGDAREGRDRRTCAVDRDVDVVPGRERVPELKAPEEVRLTREGDRPDGCVYPHDEQTRELLPVQLDRTIAVPVLGHRSRVREALPRARVVPDRVAVGV